jgi:hypothetical protein
MTRVQQRAAEQLSQAERRRRKHQDVRKVLLMVLVLGMMAFVLIAAVAGTGLIMARCGQ